MKKYIIALFAFISLSVIAENITPEEAYKERYMRDIRPQLKPALAMAFRDKNIPEKKIDEMIDVYLKAMTICQIEAFDNYDPIIKKTAFEMVANGSSIVDANMEVKRLLLEEAAKGEDQELKIFAQTKKVEESHGQCMKEKEKEFK